MQFQILLVEDDDALAMGIEYSLTNEGYAVTVAKSCQEAYQYSAKPDSNTLVLLDVMLPDGNGFEVLRKLRKEHFDGPVIFLTAAADEVNVVQGLDMGADDYIGKPFRVRELISRIHAVERRYQKAEIKEQEQNKPASKIKYRDILVDTEQALVYKTENDGMVKLELTPSEYRILLLFLFNQGVVLERNVILERIFDSRGTFVDDNTLSVYIRRLREKIGDTGKEEPYISTVRGIGYKMERESCLSAEK